MNKNLLIIMIRKLICRKNESKSEVINQKIFSFRSAEAGECGHTAL